MNVLLIGSSGKIGDLVKEELCKKKINLFMPSSEVLNLRIIDSIDRYFRTTIQKNGKGFFDYIFYCVFDKSRDNIMECNLENLKNLLLFKKYFHTWVHISSRAVYDGLHSYHKIQPIPINGLPYPENSYSQLKYNEELLLSKKLKDRCVILRLFDVTKYFNFEDIIERWLKQISKKGYCKNEILSPIHEVYFKTIVDRIIDKKISCGLYNLCGKNFISSFQEINKLMKLCVKDDVVMEKTGLMSFVL